MKFTDNDLIQMVKNIHSPFTLWRENGVGYFKIPGKFKWRLNFNNDRYQNWNTRRCIFFNTYLQFSVNHIQLTWSIQKRKKEVIFVKIANLADFLVVAGTYARPDTLESQLQPQRVLETCSDVAEMPDPDWPLPWRSSSPGSHGHHEMGSGHVAGFRDVQKLRPFACRGLGQTQLLGLRGTGDVG